tara:strand:+ start:122 stop:280 length:159 start_codon:yes stop_codon:yes gene_type:complete
VTLVALMNLVAQAAFSDLAAGVGWRMYETNFSAQLFLLLLLRHLEMLLILPQ